MRGAAQEVLTDGRRRTRWGIIRNTYPELKSTTIKTWTDWFPEEVYGPVKYDLPHSHLVRMKDPKLGEIQIEILFFALDQPKDVKKLKSLELTGAWLNEASEISQEAFDMICGRVGRYPKMIDGGPTWHGVIMDYNPPAPDHWIYSLAEEETPEGYRFFTQPPAVIPHPNGPIRAKGGARYVENPKAENRQFLPDKYYERFLSGKEDGFIKIFGMGEYGFMQEGRAVYTSYNDQVHYSAEELQVYQNLPLLLFMDFGRNPAVLFAQYTPRGQLRIIDELCAHDRGLVAFIDEMLKPHLAMHYPGMPIKGWGDPAGSWRGDLEERTNYEELHQHKLMLLPAPLPKNDFGPRKMAVDRFLNRMIDGKPAILIGPKAKMVRAGFLGKYRLARAQIPGEINMFKSSPVKNNYSHPHDALQYGCLGIDGVLPHRSHEIDSNILQQVNEHRPVDRAVGY